MIITEPVDGKCPRCKVALKTVPAEKEMGFTFIPDHVICPSCDWEPGEEIHACDWCGKTSEQLHAHGEEEYCKACLKWDETE